MKVKSYSVVKKKNAYIVSIGGEEYATSALSPDGAISNACYRYAQDFDIDVPLVAYQVRNGELSCEVKEKP
jgi:homogentisate 1,2-dioxygenase